jgi:tetratricopeptide (TPR) repeat protein
MFERNWELGEASLKRAIELDPSSTWGYYVFAQILNLQGRFDEAIDQIRRAQRLDPVSVSPVAIDAGLVYARKGDLEAALEAWQASLELAPNDYRVLRHLGNQFCQSGDFEAGLQKLNQAASVPHDKERLLSDLGYCHALAGDSEKAEEYLRKIEASESDQYVDPTHKALVYVALGRTDRALELLRRGYDIQAALLVEVPTDPRYAPLHDDPRYEDLLRGIGLQHLLPPPRG